MPRCYTVTKKNRGSGFFVFLLSGMMLLLFWSGLFIQSDHLVFAGPDQPEVKYALFGNRDFLEEKYTFAPDDVIYIVLELIDIQEGEHVLTTDWIDPWGRIERQETYRFLLPEHQENYRICSWLQLWKKGYISRALTGRDYNDKFYGIWKVKVYLDGSPVAEKSFKVV